MNSISYHSVQLSRIYALCRQIIIARKSQKGNIIIGYSRYNLNESIVLKMLF